MGSGHFSTSRDTEGIYELRGEISIHELDQFRSFLEGSFKDGEEVAISLAKVRFIDTAALQLLVVFKRGLASGRRLRISAISEEVDNILSLCGLKGVLL